MKDNFSRILCEHCGSTISVFVQHNQTIVECSYCGYVPENLPPLNILLEKEDRDEQEEDL